MATTNIKDDEQVVYTLTGTDDRGNPVETPTFDATPTWTVADTSLITATPSSDGLTCTAAAVGPEGTTTLTLAATAGGKSVGSVDTIAVTSSAPVKVVLTPGTPSKVDPATTTTPPATPATPTVPTPTVPETPVTPTVPTPTVGVPEPDHLPYYTHVGGVTTQTDWPTADVETATDPAEPLYTFAGDRIGNPPTGASAEWVVYTGAIQAVPATTTTTTTDTAPTDPQAGSTVPEAVPAPTAGETGSGVAAPNTDPSTGAPVDPAAPAEVAPSAEPSPPSPVQTNPPEVLQPAPDVVDTPAETTPASYDNPTTGPL